MLHAMACDGTKESGPTGMLNVERKYVLDMGGGYAGEHDRQRCGP